MIISLCIAICLTTVVIFSYFKGLTKLIQYLLYGLSITSFMVGAFFCINNITEFFHSADIFHANINTKNFLLTLVFETISVFCFLLGRISKTKKASKKVKIRKK